MVCSINWTTAMTTGQRNQSDLEKLGRQDHKASVHRNGGQACSSAIPTYSCGACQQHTTLCILPFTNLGSAKYRMSDA